MPPRVAGVTAPLDGDDEDVDLTTGELLPRDDDDRDDEDGGDDPPTAKELRRVRRDFTPERAREYAAAYTPQRSVLTPDEWARIEGPVRRVGELLARHPDGYERLNVRLHALTRHGAWLLRRVGPVEDFRDLLRDDTLNRWVEDVRGTDDSVADYRSTIRRLAPIVWPDGPWPQHKAPVARRLPKPPYLPPQMAALGRDARAQRTAQGRRRAEAVLVLGGGAGLDGRWAPDVTHEDVVEARGLGVRVWVPEPDRYVPVLARYVPRLLALKTLTAPGEPVIGVPDPGTDNAMGNTVKGVDQPGADPTDPWADHPVLSIARLRSTWLVEHLEAGTRLPELLAAAGLQGLNQLEGHLRYVGAWDGPRAVRHLAQGRGRR